jgi:hypothetical protein
MSAFESLPSWVGQEVAMLAQQNPQLMDQVRAISRRRAMRTFMPTAQEPEPIIHPFHSVEKIEEEKPIVVYKKPA